MGLFEICVVLIIHAGRVFTEHILPIRLDAYCAQCVAPLVLVVNSRGVISFQYTLMQDAETNSFEETTEGGVVYLLQHQSSAQNI